MNPSNVIDFPAAPVSRPRFYTPKQISALLKEKLGINCRQASVAARHSITYITITVRDPKVDVLAIESFAASIHTWTMDNTDYCEGQSVHVSTTKEVDAARRAPFMAAVLAVKLPETWGEGAEVVPGVYLWNDKHNCYVSDMNGNRGTYLYSRDVENKVDWALEAMALHVAAIVAKKQAA